MNNFKENVNLGQTEKKKGVERLTLKSGNSIEVEEITPGLFRVVDFNIVKNRFDDYLATSRGFLLWDNEVVNLEEESDTYQVLGVAENLKWNDVELTPYEIKAPTLDRLKQALNHLDITLFCKDDI